MPEKPTYEELEQRLQELEQAESGRKRAEEALQESKHHYSDLVQESPDAIISLDKTGNILSFNQTAEGISGFSTEEVIRKHFAKIDILAKHSIPKALKEFALVIAGIKRPPFELIIKRKDKSNLLMEANPRLIIRKGKKAWIAVILRDITDRKRAEEALREAEEKYRILFESSRDAIMTLAPPTWLFTSGNQATLELFRIRDEAEFISLGPWQLSPERQPDGKPSAEKAKEMIETAMRNGSHFFEWAHCHSDGTPFSAEVLLTRMEHKGQVLIQATVRDIAERKKAEEQRNKLIAELEKALSEVKTLQGFLPICSYCKKIRDDKGYWNQIESYIYKHSDAEFSHGICPECAKKHYPDFDLYDE